MAIRGRTAGRHYEENNMKTFAKVLAVVMASSVVGVSSALLIHSVVTTRTARAAQSRAKSHPLRIGAEIGKVVKRLHGQKWHSHLQKAARNEGGHGVLLVRG